MNLMRMINLGVTVVASTILVGGVWAQTKDRAVATFEKMDANGDGQLAKEELPEPLRRNFDRVDRNGDGRISITEHRAVVERSRPTKGGRGSRLSEGVELKSDLPYADTENPRQRLDLLLPKNRADQDKLPLIVFIHGGGWRAGSKESGAGRISSLVASGEYAGASIGYRLTDEAQWPEQIHDCKAAIRWLKAHAGEYGFDPERIAVWGTSAGGHLVSMLGTAGDVPELEGGLGSHTDQNSRVACVINFFGPQNMETMGEGESTIDHNAPDSPEGLLLGGAIPERPEQARSASPVTHVSEDDSPFLTAHGTKDPLVPFSQAQEIHQLLEKVGVESTLVTMVNGGHGFQSSELDARIEAFLKRHLLDADVEVSSEPIEVQSRRGK
jgi:acetyl esterase/lipase